MNRAIRYGAAALVIGGSVAAGAGLASGSQHVAKPTYDNAFAVCIARSSWDVCVDRVADGVAAGTVQAPPASDAAAGGRGPQVPGASPSDITVNPAWHDVTPSEVHWLRTADGDVPASFDDCQVRNDEMVMVCPHGYSRHQVEGYPIGG